MEAVVTVAIILLLFVGLLLGIIIGFVMYQEKLDEKDFYIETLETEIKMQNRKQLDSVMITKVEATCLVEFLEAEFIQGIGSDPDLEYSWYVNTIRGVYNRLNNITE